MAIKKFNPNDYKPPSMGIVTNTKPSGRTPGSVSGVRGGGAGGSAPARTVNTTVKPVLQAKPPNQGYITNKPKPKVPNYLNPANRKPKATPKIPDYLNPAKRKNKIPM